MTKCSVTFLFVIVILSSTNCERILFLSPLGTKSHWYGLMPAMELLAEHHNITVVAPFSIVTSSSNITGIRVDGLGELADSQSWYDFGRHKGLFATVWETVERFSSLQKVAYKALMSGNEQFRRILDDRSVDLVILDAIHYEFLLPAVDSLRVPFIFYSPGGGTPWNWASMAVSQEYATVPSMHSVFSDQMDLVERGVNMLASEFLLLARRLKLMAMVDRLAERDFPGSRPSAEIERHAQLCLANIPSVTAWPKSLPPTVIPVGAMHCRPPRQLPDEWKSLADKADDGFIVFTLGSNAQSSRMPERIRQAFVRTFARFPKLSVFWKWESNDDAKKNFPDNVVPVDWLPQQDLLGKKK